ncbi:MAG: hypothetical protein FD167_3436 [bacterium]|nr:MAG: hypothetical protein FD167_3436 [bacterium]
MQRLKLVNLLKSFPEPVVLAIFMLINGSISLIILGLIAKMSHLPFIFPSLGPTAFLHFFTPTLPSASPRNTIYGHIIGIVCGYGALLIFGLNEADSALLKGIPIGVDNHRILAVGVSIGLTGALMILLKCSHPPAGATTLIISLGVITRPIHLLIMLLAVSLLVLQTIIINRLAGIDYPFWEKKHSQ